MKKKTNGFTLVELLAVIVILALIMAIAIPAVLTTTNSAKKESFYLYAQSLQSKAIAAYTQDIENDIENAECVVYDIGEDLDLSDVGDYEGWVKVSRTAVLSEQKTAEIVVQSDKKLEYVNYCVARGNSCEPNSSYNFTEGTKTVTIRQTINDGQVLCVNYQYADDDKKLVTSSKECQLYKDATGIVNDYDYQVILTFKDNNYYVKNLVFNDDMSKKEFYSVLDTNKETIQNDIKAKKVNPMQIESPTCSAADVVEIKGTTTAKGEEIITTTIAEGNKTCPAIDESKKYFNIKLDANGGNITTSTIKQCVDCSDSVSIETPVRNGYNFDGWYYDKKFSKKLVSLNSKYVDVSEDKDTAGCLTGYNDVILYAKWSLTGSATTTTQGVEYITTTGQNEKSTTYVGENNNTTTRKTTIVSNQSENSTTSVKTTIVNDPATTSTTTRGTTIVNDPATTSTTTRGTTIVNDPSNGSTTTRKIEYISTTTTTIDSTDDTLLLDTLNIIGYNIGFSPIKFYYELTIPTSVNSLDITYKAHTPEATDVYLLNNTDLKVGDTWVVVRLRNKETGKESNYRILVTKLSNKEGYITTAPTTTKVVEWDPESGLPDPSLDESNAGLSYLNVNGYVLGFDPNVYEYKLKVYETTELKVSYETYAKNAMVNIDGADSVHDGSVITVYSQSPNGFYHKTYTIEIDFIEKTSNQTKFLRNAALILGMTLPVVLVVSIINKTKGSRMIRKNKSNNSNNNPDNIA